MLLLFLLSSIVFKVTTLNNFSKKHFSLESVSFEMDYFSLTQFLRKRSLPNIINRHLHVHFIAFLQFEMTYPVIKKRFPSSYGRCGSSQILYQRCGSLKGSCNNPTVHSRQCALLEIPNIRGICWSLFSSLEIMSLMLLLPLGLLHFPHL